MEEIKFSELNKEVQIGRCTIPQAVFVTLNPDDEITEQVIERQEKFLKLPENIKDKLVSHETAEKIKAIGAHYNLELLQMAPIARVIRSYYFGEVKLEDFARVISEESKINLVDAQNIVRYIIDRIIKKEVAVIAAVPTVKMAIAQAIEKYPEIQEQILTSAPIEIIGQAVRPTIKNWTTDYFNTVGAGNRDIMKRSSYLYHSKNVKSLNVVDRQKLSSVLKSLDEGFMLRIDTVKKEIIFDSAPIVNKVAAVNPALNIDKKVEPLTPNPSMIARTGMARTQGNVNMPEKAEERPMAPRESLIKENRIQHVQGNNWDLKSAHFMKRDEFDNKIANGGNQEGIKFSSPQQLPVEKENDIISSNTVAGVENKKEYRKNFLGKIEPIE